MDLTESTCLRNDSENQQLYLDLFINVSSYLEPYNPFDKLVMSNHTWVILLDLNDSLK